MRVAIRNMIEEKKEGIKTPRYTPRKMYQGNWKCSECGAEITELPFEPTRDVYCGDCYYKRRTQIR